MKVHELYIKRCIQLARNGLGSTYPNPMVGSVIVHEDKIIGEGWHQKTGEPHAEVNAINSVEDTSLLTKATIYVNLEPCSHYGKTPPCSDLIVAKGIKKVVIGTTDPFKEVAGRGIKKLMDAGCHVIVGVLEDECFELNKRFFCFHAKKRPYIILKWAATRDGFIAPIKKNENRPVWITNQYSGQLVHKWRSEEAAIVVGTNTAAADNPKLNLRKWSGNNPVRVVIDKDLKLPEQLDLFDGTQQTIVLCEKIPEQKPRKNLLFESISFSENIAAEICKVLYKNQIQSVIIEGGKHTLQQFIDADLWDEARIFTGDKVFKKGVLAPEFKPGKPIAEKSLKTDHLKIYKHD